MKATRRQEKVVNLILKFSSKLYDDGEKEIEKLVKKYNADKEKLLNEIAMILLKYKVINSMMDLKRIERISLYKTLVHQIDEFTQMNKKTEKDVLTSLLLSTAYHKFNTNNYVFILGSKLNLKNITDKEIKKILDVRIDGKLYSDRIYKNKNEVSAKLKKDIDNLLKGKTSINDIEKSISKRFGTLEEDTKRLIENEVSRVQSQVNELWMQKNNIQYVIYSSALDHKVCEYCSQYEGQVFFINERPVELPQHVRCRCIYIPITNTWEYTNEITNITWDSYLNSIE
ncbi:minor capsid protein [Clostridioides difficile]|uniref:minor capsid protein n=1 Tax=Clostridioides difficile TaxID=1496 RepID=UPI00188A0EAE|nr:minor capsid protein [Clostridioides difficile]EJX3465928.1 minor capsid protein [Clostridioides difficile]EKS6825692.1 minor capsid protein [Clostridioides difficile]EKS7089939.1 minor capsid protein [Clostridioides difficile]MBF4702315.1 minor capsid protein [Clostridioides difficile]MBH7477688.1 minor capsid protein [Clostridioides difficile]